MKRKLSVRPLTKTKNPEPRLGQIDWVIWAAWADRVTFEEIREKTDFSESEVIDMMRRHLKPSSFRRWRKRVNTTSIKHRKRFEAKRRDLRPQRFLYATDSDLDETG